MSAPMIVHKATGWLPDGRRITAEDYDSPQEATNALGEASRLLLGPSATYWAYRLEALSDHVEAILKLDPARPYGRAILVE